MDRHLPIILVLALGYAPAASAQMVRHHSAASALAVPVATDASSPDAANPASLTGGPRFAIVVHAARPYHLPTLRSGRVGIVRAGRGLAAGVFAEQTGYDEYAETSFGVAGARAFEAGPGVSISFGMRAAFTNTAPRGYEARRSAAVGFGWLLHVDSVFSIGASLREAPLLSQQVLRQAPTLSLGASVRMNEAVMLTLQIHRERGFEASLGVGVALSPVEPLTLRLGTTSAPVQLCTGIGLNVRRLVIDLSFVSHPVLGLSSSITISLRLA